MASAMISPIEASLLAEIEPTWAISLWWSACQLLQLFDGGANGLVDAALQVHRVHAGGNVLHAFAHDGLGQHGGGGGAVTGVVAGLGSDFLDHLRAHVLQLVLQFDFLGHGHAVLGHGRAAEAALQHHVAALRAQGHLDCVGEDVHAFDHAWHGRRRRNYVFCCHVLNLRIWMDASRWIVRGTIGNWVACGRRLLVDDSHDVFFAHDQQFLAIDLDGLAGVLAEQHAVAHLDVQGDVVALVILLARADASTSP
jgi:hypothetical protein